MLELGGYFVNKSNLIDTKKVDTKNDTQKAVKKINCGKDDKVYTRENIGFHPNQETVDFQLGCIRCFMLLVGKVQAEYLLKKGKLKEKDVKRFTKAEASALDYETIKEKTGKRFLFKIHNWVQSGRWPHGMSWLLERVNHLISPANAKPLVLEKPKNIVVSTGCELSTAITHGSSRVMGDFILCRVRIDEPRAKEYAAKLQDLKSLYSKGKLELSDIKSKIPLREPLEIGKSIMHELAIHAWRCTYFPTNREMKAKFPGFSVHQASYHSGQGNSDVHNWADLEADIIDLYHPYIEEVGISEIKQICPDSGKSEEKAGTIMGDFLRWQKWSGIYK